MNHIYVKHVAEAIKKEYKSVYICNFKIAVQFMDSSTTIVAQSTPIILWIAVKDDSIDADNLC